MNWPTAVVFGVLSACVIVMVLTAVNWRNIEAEKKNCTEITSLPFTVKNGSCYMFGSKMVVANVSFTANVDGSITDVEAVE